MMKKLLMIAFLAMTGLTAVWSQGEEPLQQVVERGLNRAAVQSLILAKELKEQSDALPRTFEKGKTRNYVLDTRIGNKVGRCSVACHER